MWCVLLNLADPHFTVFPRCGISWNNSELKVRHVTFRKKIAPFCPQGSRTRQDIMGSSVKAPVEREWTSSSLLAWTGDDELFWQILRPSWKSMQTKYTCAWHSIKKGVLYQSALSAMLRLLLAAMESEQRLLLLSSHQTKLKLVWQTAARWWGQRGAAIISCCFFTMHPFFRLFCPFESYASNSASLN